MFFQINVTPKAKRPPEVAKEAPEPQAVLVLAPFQPQPRLHLESVILVQAQTSLVVRNTSNRPLTVKVSKSPPEERAVTVNPTEVTIPAETDSILWVSWMPREAGSWRDSIQLTDSRRLKYDIPLTTVCINPKKSSKSSKSSKPKTQKILAPSNGNATLQRHRAASPPRKAPQRLPENKENLARTSMFPPPRSQQHQVFAQSMEVSGVFDISSYQLTPLKSTSTITKLSDPGMKTPELEFSPRPSKFASPNEAPQLPPDRRDTYTTSNPKFCHLPTLQPVQSEAEEDFDDSLSPRPEEPNFSAMMNNIATLDTPQKSLHQIQTATITKNHQEKYTFANKTFEINKSREDPTLPVPSVKQELFFPLNIKTSPQHYHEPEENCRRSVESTRLQQDDPNRFVTPTRISRSTSHDCLPPFPPTTHHLDHRQSEPNLLSPYDGFAHFKLTRTSPTMPASSSPLPPFKNGDPASVREVIEADLWLKDEPRDRSASLQSIAEESPFCRQVSAPHSLNFTEVFVTPLKPTVFEISPTKARLTRTIKPSICRVSPKKPAKVTKVNFSQSLKKKITSQKIPGVRSTLSLAKLQKPKEAKEAVVKLHDPNDLVSHVFNPDPFAATMTEDPFLASTLYYDERWMYNQELEFKKWLNALLTPPEHLTADVDTVRVDVGKVWQSCRGKESIPLAETREAVSARYHTNHRLNTLRKAATAMFNKPEVTSALSKTIIAVEKGSFVVRQDRDLHRDIGLQKEILELFFSYNPLWLRIGLEVVYGETIPLSSNNDLVGLTKFLISRFFSDPFLVEKHSHPNVSLKTPSFLPALNKFILKKFLLLVFFLDYAKRNKLIGHDPCLFHKKAVYKESREILLNFARQTLSGVGDVTKILRPFGYVVSHKQTYLDEYDYAVKDLAVDLRDGVRLCRVMELIIGDKNLTSRCRVPAISRLQKVHNAELALSALHRAGYVITGDIDAKSVADGHREKTLSLLWQIIYKFQAPRFDRAARVLQRWWRAQLWFVRVKRFLQQTKSAAAVRIQCTWRSYHARRLAKALRKQREEELRRRDAAARIVQVRWRSLKDRRRYLRLRRAALVLQRSWRRYTTSRPYLLELQKKKDATVVIQQFFRRYRVMKADRNDYLAVRTSALVIQRWYRAVSQTKRQIEEFNRLKSTTVFVQRRWRANKQMEFDREAYLRIRRSVTVLQAWWRGVLLMKRTRNEFVITRHAARVICSWYVSVKLREEDRRSFLETRRAVTVVQRAWRRYRDTKPAREHFKQVASAALLLQTWWRRARAQKTFRTYLNSILLIQRWFRNTQKTCALRSSYLVLRKATLFVQKTWRMKRTREKYLKMKESVLIVENWYLNARNSRNLRREFLAQRNAALLIQRRWRSTKLTRQLRSNFVTLRTVAIFVQRRWRSKTLTRKARADFLSWRSAAIQIQSVWRMILARNKFLVLLRQHNSAAIIQRRWRARKLARETRESYVKQREAAIRIQRKYRATLAAREARQNYLNLRNAAIVLQRRLRAQWAMVKHREAFENLKSATICLQAMWRMRKSREAYTKLQKSVIKIQAHWKSLRNARKVRADFLRLKAAALLIQRRFRAKLEGGRVRAKLLRVRRCVVTIQRRWRAKLRAREEEKAAVVIQNWWRSTVLTRRLRRSFELQRNSAIVVQRHFRAYKLMRIARGEFMRVRMATVRIQRTWRRHAARGKRRNLIEERKQAAAIIEIWWRAVKARKQKEREEREAIRRLEIAATQIQALWRGYRVRREQSAAVRNLRARARMAAEAAVPSETVAYRLHEAMNGLMTFSNIGQLTLCLACIDTLTRLSIRGCVIFCDLELVEKVYDLLEQSNRSLPWMDVCLRCTNILITLAKLPDTAARVRRLDYMETVARLMNVTVKKETELFLNLATLLWLLVGDEEFAEAVVNDQRTAWLVRSACVLGVKRESRLTPVKKKATSFEKVIIYPNTRPDWGLATRRPRCFTKVEHAIFALAQVFKINNIF